MEKHLEFNQQRQRQVTNVDEEQWETVVLACFETIKDKNNQTATQWNHQRRKKQAHHGRVLHHLQVKVNLILECLKTKKLWIYMNSGVLVSVFTAKEE